MKINSSESGKILYNEFLAAMVNKSAYMEDELLLDMFNIFDLNQDGFIDMDELKEVLLSKDKTLYYKNQKGDSYYQ